MNVNKFRDKYEGPYVVKKACMNGLTYVLERVDENGKGNELRAHHNQLRKWREPPLYLKNHPVYELCRIRTTEMEREKEYVDRFN